MKKTLTYAATTLCALFLVACGGESRTYTNVNGNADVTPGASPENSVCHVEVELSQSHFTIDPFQHLKDAMNSETFLLPTSCNKAQSLSPGASLIDDFRGGSFLIDGSIGNWDLEVQSVPKNIADIADQSSCDVTLRLAQSRFSIDPFQHLKDAMNAVDFNWEVPCSVHENLNVGDDLIEDGFRAGSFLIRGSIGGWDLQVIEKGPATTNTPTNSPIDNSAAPSLSL